ncbi:MAG: MFS transporter [Azospirillaceae bacterium]|nr:MFS transporter [Azospirillaceae bacterium]
MDQERHPSFLGAHKDFYVTLLIVSRVFFSFVCYFIIGISFAILPTYVHVQLGYSYTVSGLVISIQYFATLASRAATGRQADRFGAKKTVLIGLAGCTVSGLLLLPATLPLGAWWNLLPLAASRLMLGFSESYTATGATLWGMGRVGFHRTARVISWNGVATWGALAAGAPTGVMLDQTGGFTAVSWFITGFSALGFLLALLPKPSPIVKGRPQPMRTVVWRVFPHGMGLALAGVGTAMIMSFITLFFGEHGWPNAALDLTVFGICFVGIRLLFARQIDRRGGLLVALISLAIETLGLTVLGLAGTPILAMVGTGLAGCGFSLIFPALGVVAVNRAGAANQGPALGIYTVFADVSLGVAGPVGGRLIARYDYPAAFLFGATAAAVAFLLTFWLWHAARHESHPVAARPS